MSPPSSKTTSKASPAPVRPPTDRNAAPASLVPARPAKPQSAAKHPSKPFAGWNSALLKAAAKGDVAACVEALEQGADPLFQGEANRTTLFVAIEQGHEKAAIVLAIATPPAELDALNGYPWGFTALVGACEFGMASLARCLVQRGARLEKRNDGMTPLMIAAKSPHLDSAMVVSALLELGADPKAAGPNGKSALWLAATLGTPASIELLAPVSDASLTVAGKNLFSAAAHARSSPDGFQCILSLVDLWEPICDGLLPIEALAAGRFGLQTGQAEMASILLSAMRAAKGSDAEILRAASIALGMAKQADQPEVAAVLDPFTRALGESMDIQASAQAAPPGKPRRRKSL